MDLYELKNPLFLKDLDLNEVKDICKDIRDFIIDFTAEQGGYLSGNLSAVELSVMLERSFDQQDKLIYDGNDINYTHKILNGMISELKTNSNGAYSLANALGLAASRDLDHKHYHVAAVVNSTDLLSGRNIEALNLISNFQNRLIIVFNDDTTIDRGIGIVDRLINTVRTTNAYTSMKDNVKDMIRPKKSGEKIIENIHNIKSNIKRNVIDEGIFSEFNIDYIGPIDGHNLNDLERAFAIAREKEYPCVVHCLTSKGKGYGYAESCTNDAWNKVGPFDKQTGKMLNTENDDFRFARNIAGMTVERLMADDPDIVTIASRNINEYGVAGIFAKYPERCFDTSSSAENSLSFASGLALDGKIPFIALKSFEMANAYRIIRNQLCKLNKPMIVGIIVDGTLNYGLLNELGNIYICEPKDGDDLQDLLYSGTKADKPLLVIYPEKCLEYKEKTAYEVKELGKWTGISDNDINKVTVIASGSELKLIEEIIFSNELNYDLINCETLNPLDKEYLYKLSNNNKKIFVYGHKNDELLLKYLNDNKVSNEVYFVENDGVDKLFAFIKEKTDA